MKVADHTAITCEERLPRLTKLRLLCRQAKTIPDVCLLRSVADTPDRVFFTTNGELTAARVGCGEIFDVAEVPIVVFRVDCHRHPQQTGPLPLDLHLDSKAREIGWINSDFVLNSRVFSVHGNRTQDGRTT